MKNTKLIRILRLFTKEEFKRFGLFVDSPYFNSLGNVSKLYHALKQYFPEFKNKNFTKENIFSEISPGEKYNDLKMRVLASYLLSLAEKFFSVQSYLEGSLNVSLNTINALKDKEDNYFSKKCLEEAEGLLKKYPAKDADYYFMLSKVLFEKNILTSHFAAGWGLQKETDSLAVYFIITTLRTYATAYNRKNLLQTELRTGLLDSVLKLADSEPYKRIPAVKMNLALYMLTRFSNEEKYFFKFLELTDKYPLAMSKEEMYEVHFLMLNFCVIKIQKGQPEFIEIKFGLYKKMLDRGYFDTEKQNFFVFYNNIVSSAIENKDYGFAENFIEKYKQRLSTNTGKDVVELCYAKLNYALKKYEKATKNLSRIKNNEDIFYKLALKDLTIKIYFETAQYESILSIIDSYRHFLGNNPLLTEEVKKRYGMYLKSLGELLKIKIAADTRKEKEKALELKEAIAALPGFVYKDWLLEKINGILIK